MNTTYVYKITRNDGKVYIGITVDLKKRLKAHENSIRFSMGIKEFEVLNECTSYEEAEDLEEFYIDEFDTFENGLNLSKNGKGNHNSKNFTTRNYKYSQESRLKMSESAKKRVIRIGPPNAKPMSKEVRKKLSNIRKGICWGPKKISDSDCESIVNAYMNDSLIFDPELVKTYIKKGQREIFDSLSFTELKSGNGKPLSKITLYSHYYSELYDVTPACIRRIIKNVKRAKSYE